MSLSAVLSVASGGLANINAQLDVVSQNVANASTPNYAREIAAQTSLTADGQGLGVRTGATGRALDIPLQAILTTQNGVVSGLATRQAALQPIDAAQGTPGDGTDLASLVGDLQDAFSTLLNDPSNQTQQQAAVGAAQNLTGQINGLAGAVGTARQNAQDAIVGEVGTLNTTLATIGTLSTQIVQLQAAGQSTADLENQRDAAVGTLSQLVDVRMLEQPDGDALLFTPSGLSLPIHATTPPFATSAASTGPTATYPGGIAAITLNGQDVTAQLTGGSLGANITLRDQTLPTYQCELDEFASTLSQRFAQQGLSLFTDPTGAVPTASGTPVQSGYVGYADSIQVNPAVLADPSLVRDGTQAVAGSATGASAFTPNPAGGPAGFATMITRVLDYALGTDQQQGVAQSAPAISGLGPAGNLQAPFAAPADLASFATAVVGAEAQDSAATTSQLTTEQGVQTSLGGQLSSATGVSIDQEMSNMIELQNAYGANAQVISAIRTAWQQLLQMVS